MKISMPAAFSGLLALIKAKHGVQQGGIGSVWNVHVKTKSGKE